MKHFQRSDIAYWTTQEASICPDLIKVRLGTAKVKDLAATYVSESFRRIENPAFSEMQYGLCKIPGTTEQDYRYRQVDTPFGKIITSIRFIGGDLAKPAVFIMHKDFPITEVSAVRELGRIVKNAYSIFRPQRFRWYAPENRQTTLLDNDHIQGDMIYVAAYIDHLRKRPNPTGYERIELRPADSLDWFARYVGTYESINAQWPAFKEMAGHESRNALQQLMDEGLLFEAFVNGELAGIIGARASSEYFFEGYVIVEELLFDAYRGKRLAPALQRHLVQRLPKGEHNMLFGTIHHDNQPSLKTALRTGRMKAGTYLFADI